MELVTAPSKSSQVAEIIRKNIKSGQLKPGSKLQSVRTLADEFNVGRQVILSAFNLLTREKFIHLKARQGAFVMDDQIRQTGRDIYFFAYGVQKSNKYMEKILQISCPPHLRKDYSFFTRIIPYEQMSDDVLELELKRIDDTHGIDAVIIHSAMFNRKQIKRCLEMRSPVIFIGDFQKGKFSDLPINKVTVGYKFITHYLRYLLDRGYRQTGMLISSLNYSYNREFADFTVAEAKKLSMKLTIKDLPVGVHTFSEAKQDQAVSNALNKMIKKKVKSLIVAGVNFNIVRRNLDKMNIRIPKDIEIISTSEDEEGIPCLEVDFSKMYERVYELLEKLFENRNISERHVVNCDYKIVNKWRES